MVPERPRPKVALVVPTHNRKAKTLRFLAQMADQTYVALQVIIVDAGSRDGTPEAVNQQFPLAVVLPVNARNFWAGATNAGVRYALEAGFDYVLTMNDDAVVQPTKLTIWLIAIAFGLWAPIPPGVPRIFCAWPTAMSLSMT